MDRTESAPQDRYIARDASWLDFNERVLEEAADTRNPLLERARFLAIFVNNLDEFIMVRQAGLAHRIRTGITTPDRAGQLPQEFLPLLRGRMAHLVKRLYSLYEVKIRPELAEQHVTVKLYADTSNEQRRFIKQYFETTLFPIITPFAVDQGRPFPLLPSKTLAFAVSLSRYAAQHLAILPIPKNVPRFLRLPSAAGITDVIMVDEILRRYLESFFRGFKINGQVLFRILRDGELFVAEEEADDLLVAIEGQLKQRPRARIIHVEVENNEFKDILAPLCEGLEFPEKELTVVDGTLDLTCLFELMKLVERPDLRFAATRPQRLAYENVFDRIKEGAFILHLPYQSFEPTVDLIHAAAADPSVLALKMTLYRTNEDSAIISALKQAAQQKKQVTVLVEIRARFDEERNISWVRELEEAGCHVMYGIAGMKIHSKILLVVRKEESMIRRYVHLSTGNYNEKTAEGYTDIGYFTANDDFARDISDVFNVITGYSLPSVWKRIVSSPNDLRQYFVGLIDKEIEYAKKFKTGVVFAKMNSLEDQQIIDKLYEASQAGVKIKLIVRGICCLIPGVPGLSDNIEVRSIVGRFLEHSRIYIFGNNTNHRIFLSSADWMQRNFDRRIELLFEMHHDALKEQLQLIMNISWQDNQKAWMLLPDKRYAKIKAEGEKINAQEFLLRHYQAT